jgi:uncharacterized protein YbaP (TraB family)
MTKRVAAWLLAVGVFGAGASAAFAQDDDLSTTVLDTVVVSGKMPGPGLWKISKGDHVMWLLGTISPLPKRMDWESAEVEATIASSQELLMPPNAEIDAGVGMLRGLFLLPSLMKARNNPDKQPLREVVPPELYARWSVQKEKYLGRDRGVEKRRPLVAAQELHEEALDDLDLSQENVAARVARKAAKKHDVPITRPTLKIRLENAKEAIKDLSATTFDDEECLSRTLTRLETEIETLKLRANAWAMGETAILEKLAYTDNFKSCAQAIFESQLAEKHGFGDIEGRLRTTWIDAADAALQKNTTTFALLPMVLIVREDGFVTPLIARGYRVQGPAELAREAEREEESAEDGVQREDGAAPSEPASDAPSEQVAPGVTRNGGNGAPRRTL